jgi:hypothetical protein
VRCALRPFGIADRQTRDGLLEQRFHTLVRATASRQGAIRRAYELSRNAAESRFSQLKHHGIGTKDQRCLWARDAGVQRLIRLHLLWHANRLVESGDRAKGSVRPRPARGAGVAASGPEIARRRCLLERRRFGVQRTGDREEVPVAGDDPAVVGRGARRRRSGLRVREARNAMPSHALRELQQLSMRLSRWGSRARATARQQVLAGRLG